MSHHTRFVEKCRRDPALLKALLFAKMVGDHYGRDLLHGLEQIRMVYIEHKEAADLALTLLPIWMDDPNPNDEELGEDNSPLGSKGC